MTTYVYVYQEWDILKEINKDSEHKVEKISFENTQRPSFCFLLQQARIKKRMTTTDVANHLKIPAKMVSLYENGSEIPDESVAMILRELLDI